MYLIISVLISGYIYSSIKMRRYGSILFIIFSVFYSTFGKPLPRLIGLANIPDYNGNSLLLYILLLFILKWQLNWLAGRLLFFGVIICHFQRVKIIMSLGKTVQKLWLINVLVPNFYRHEILGK